MAERQVPVRFLLGPAGSGKTFRCLEEARAALRADPDGPALLFLAPKQATFQLERQLLADLGLPGYTRLHILSFERLAEMVLRRCGAPLRPLLAEEGRVMVLRALLAKARSGLSVFRATARLPGFARQLSEVVRELEQHNVTPERLRQVAAQADPRSRLRGKLLDLATMGVLYREWLDPRGLEDSSCLLRLAQEALEPPSAPLSLPVDGGANVLTSADRGRTQRPEEVSTRRESRVHPKGRRVESGEAPLSEVRPPAEPWFGALWLDGFAEMTPAELDLAAAIIPRCARATLAFCVEGPTRAPGDWLSPWSLVGRTQAALGERLARYRGLVLSNECLADSSSPTRFASRPALRHLERFWVSPRPYGGGGSEALPIRLMRCANPEAEAITAARAVLRFVREDQGRYREAAVLVRSLDGYQAVIRRVFARYGLPIFLDRRESVAHHPLAELTRSALRMVANGWRTEDWMSVLKTGLAGDHEQAVDALENAALAAGWEGETWLGPLPHAPEVREAAGLESLRSELVPPFAALTRRLHPGLGPVTGSELAESLRRLWTELNVGATLNAWTEAAPELAVRALAPAAGPMHATVWRDLNALLKNLALAFKEEAMPLREWLPILEAGLSGLTVGVVPPALDQVLVGAIDRSRNPDLRLVVLLGWNDGVFPAPLPTPPLLTEAERRELELNGVSLGPDRRRRIGRERYYAYIACTRARQRLVVTFAERDTEDRPLNPSPFVRSLRRLFPTLTEEITVTRPGWAEIEHAQEAVVPWLRLHHRAGRAEPVGSDRTLPGLGRALELLPVPWTIELNEALLPVLADHLYGRGVMRTSVSRLEQFAACPFQFYVHSGLRAEERQLFEVDVRQTGGFQHAVLARFHADVTREGKQWRDLTPSAARERVARIAQALVDDFASGLFRADAQRRFNAQSLSRSLQDFIEVMVEWMHSAYAFDPVGAELVFGAVDSELPGWDIDLGNGQRLRLQGKIDRVDLARVEGRDEALCVVIDYKSSARRVDSLLLEHGIQIQLPTYLAALCALGRERPLFDVARLTPAGMFYANLRGDWERALNRSEASANRAVARREAYCHRGRFSLDVLPRLDRLWDQPAVSGQFRYARGGKPSRAYQDPLPASALTALLDRVERTVRELGRQVLDGVARVAPFVKGANETACRTCRYESICRFDPWLHEYRRLQAPKTAATG